MAHGSGSTAGYGIRYPLGSDPVDINQFFQDLAEDAETALKALLTTTQRDALAGGNLWTGRRIYNTTTSRFEYYNGAAWVPVSNLNVHPFLTQGA